MALTFRPISFLVEVSVDFFLVCIPLQIVLFKYMSSKRFCLKCLHTFFG